MAVEPGLHAAVEHTVTDADTAVALGSGDVPVLGTPRLLALAEAATVAALAGHLADGQTSVGTRVELDHLAATPVGAVVRVRAELAAVDGRSLRFAVTATDGSGAVIGRGTVSRTVVDRNRFLSRP
ncbi:MAG TPA: hotdog domain-containing protein [Pseudonocardiaceae bacterium]|jgi:predicted thioesterase